jgi:rhodanese-related sulfurtransferase
MKVQRMRTSLEKHLEMQHRNRRGVDDDKAASFPTSTAWGLLPRGSSSSSQLGIMTCRRGGRSIVAVAMLVEAEGNNTGYQLLP